MTLGNLVEVCACGDQAIILVDANQWLGTFPANQVPVDYIHKKIIAIKPDSRKGSTDTNGVFKVLVE